MRRALGLASATVIAAAGGCAAIAGIDAPGDRLEGGSSSVSVTGTIGGRGVPQNYAVGLNGGDLVWILVTNSPGGCSLFPPLQANDDPPNASLLSMIVITGSTSVPPGTYPVVGSTDGGTELPWAEVTYSLTDAKCTAKPQVRGVSGWITLTTSNQSTIAGSFAVAFEGGDHLTGSFSVAVCAYDAGAETGPGTCGS